jgi:hypothetical protein
VQEYRSVCTAIIFAISGYFILSYVKQIGKESSATILHLSRTRKLVTVVRYVLVAIIAFVVLQILITLQYNTFTLALTISNSYGLWIMTMALLARAFYSWYKSIAYQSESQKKILILILGFSMLAYVINGIFLIASYLVWLEEQPSIILSTDVAFFPDFEPESLVSQIGAIAQTANSFGCSLCFDMD